MILTATLIMDMIRRNTDYALCLMVHLAENYGCCTVSTREAAEQEQISYPVACKLLQKLQKHKLVKSTMGPAGGFVLNKEPAKINLLDIIGAIQGPLSLNRCMLGDNVCPRQGDCPITGKLETLQEYIKNYLGNITLESLL